MQIYRLSDGQREGFVSTSALADIINVSAPAVNRMVTRLRDHGHALPRAVSRHPSDAGG
ncbi:MAG: hypothetical protein IPK17_37230 [Chloroflexi bacterium]|uniref:hypothetical protein n=1 Tax=Candidatus Flexifilum breve TaxID=3140694 RepID=UPI0031351261|nr:hypothetical protein [Chloroflexota bacterium]